MSVSILSINVMINWILYVFIAVSMDTIFGLGRAIKHHKWNSSAGIDGAIRKISMLACMTFMVMLDAICGFNLIKVFPKDVAQMLLQIGLAHVGFAEFFGILFVAYECVSILKNMTLCGLPVKWVWVWAYNFLHKYTNELPDTEGMEFK